MNRPPLGFRRLLFHLRAQEDGIPTLAAIEATYCKEGGRLFVPASSSVSIDNAQVSRKEIAEDVWSRFVCLSAAAACTRLLLLRTKDPVELDNAIQYLQRECGLQPVGTGPRFGKGFIELLRSGLPKFELFPFEQRRIQKKYTTCIHDAAIENGLSPAHFQFVLDEPDEPIVVGSDLHRYLTASKLEQLLQVGYEIKAPFRADWKRMATWEKCPKAPGDTVPLTELGPILGHYSDLIKLPLPVVADRFQSWSEKGDSQWPHHPLGTKEDIQAYFEKEFFKGLVDEQVPFHELKRLLSAFDNPDDVKDVPELMAEWLTAESRACRCIRLPFDQFSSPGAGKHGVKTTYTNAPFRLEGMECAFVRLEFEANTEPPKAQHGKGEVVDRLTQLLRNIDDEDTLQIPHSNLHVHPGDELIFVLKGTVFVELENTGLWTPLLEGDFIHFNAEIPHAVWNTGKEPAVAVVVRFFQLERDGTRRRQVETLSEIESLMSQLDKDYSAPEDSRIPLLDRLAIDFPKWVRDTRDSFRLWKEIAPWVHDRTRPPQDRLRAISDDSRVQDLVGLSKFLHTHIAHCLPKHQNRPASLDKLAAAIRALEEYRGDKEASSDNGFELYVKYRLALAGFCRNQFQERDIPEVRSCFEGVPAEGGRAPGMHVLSEVARLIGIPRVLLDGYLATTALRVVVVRGAKAAGPDAMYDWVQPLDGARGKNAVQVQYLLPSRALANSDMSVTILDLQARGHSDWNFHPGFELLIPLSGNVHVEFEDGVESPTDVVDDKQMLVYRSAHAHRVCNAQSSSARVVVMRFNIAAPLPNS